MQKYKMSFVDYDEINKVYTYNVYQRKFYFFWWPIAAFEDRFATKCRDKCRELIKQLEEKDKKKKEKHCKLCK